MPKETWKPGNMLYPVPAVMVSCADAHGHDNIITVAWAGTVCSDPPMVGISVRPERFSYAMLRETGEFVVNLVGEDLAFACDWCGVRSGRDVDKWEQMHLDRQPPAALEHAPAIAQSPVNIECKVTQVLELGSHHLFIGRVAAVRVDDALIDDAGKLHLDRAHLIAYSHGEYAALGDVLGTFGYSVRKKPAAQAGEGRTEPKTADRKRDRRNRSGKGGKGRHGKAARANKPNASAKARRSQPRAAEAGRRRNEGKRRASKTKRNNP